jgi:NADH:ubiquinone oxidoreductase subunit E
VKGGLDIKSILETLVGCQIGEETADGKIGLHLGQCNGTCDNAPQVWVNGVVIGPLDSPKTVELVRELKERTGSDAPRESSH